MNLHTAKASSPCLGFQELEKFKQMQDYSLYQCWVFFMCENQNVGVRQMAGLLQLLALQFTNHECAISQACSSKSSSSVTCVPLSLPRSYTLRVDPPPPHLHRTSQGVEAQQRLPQLVVVIRQCLGQALTKPHDAAVRRTLSTLVTQMVTSLGQSAPRKAQQHCECGPISDVSLRLRCMAGAAAGTGGGTAESRFDSHRPVDVMSR